MAEIEMVIHWKFPVIHCLTAMVVVYLKSSLYNLYMFDRWKKGFRRVNNDTTVIFWGWTIHLKTSQL